MCERDTQREREGERENLHLTQSPHMKRCLTHSTSSFPLTSGKERHWGRGDLITAMHSLRACAQVVT